MKKRAVAVALSVCSMSLYASDDIKDVLLQSKVEGSVLLFYIDRNYFGNPNIHQNNRNGTSLGGNLKYSTGAFYGLSATANVLTTNRIFQFMETKNKVDTTIFGPNGQSYTILGEAYLNFNFEETTGSDTGVRIGYQYFNTPMLGVDDVRTIESFYNGYVITNSDLPGLDVTVAQITDIAPGTFANAYNGGGIIGVTAGYSAIPNNSNTYQMKWVNMGTWAFGKHTDGVTVLGADYKLDTLHLKAWNNIAYNLFNTLYLEADYQLKLLKAFSPFAGAQYINQQNIGSGYAGTVDSNYFGFKVGTQVYGLTLEGAYSQTGKNSRGDFTDPTDGTARSVDARENAILSPWGGMPAYTQGMVTRHQFIAGTQAYKVKAIYNFKPDVGVNLKLIGYYAWFDMAENNGVIADLDYTWTATEPGADVIWTPEWASNDLMIRFRCNFPRKFVATPAGNDTDWDEYRFIVNYAF